MEKLSQLCTENSSLALRWHQGALYKDFATNNIGNRCRCVYLRHEASNKSEACCQKSSVDLPLVANDKGEGYGTTMSRSNNNSRFTEDFDTSLSPSALVRDGDFYYNAPREQ